MDARRFRRQAIPAVTRVVKLRQRQHASDRRGLWSRVGFLAPLAVSLVLVTMAGIGVEYYSVITRDLPSPSLLSTQLNPSTGSLLQPTRLYDRGHNHVLLTLQDPAATDKKYLTVGETDLPGTSQAPKLLIDATIAGLDPGFWEEGRFSLAGVWQGTGSDLAQRLASELLLDGEPASLNRNVRVRLLAAQLSSQYGREQVLEWYLNSAKYGEAIYGADTASRVYFGIPAAKLTVSQAALLTALAEIPDEGPSHLGDALKQRQELIIQRMLVDGYIAGDQAFAALKDDVTLQTPHDAQSLAPEFTTLVLQQLSTIMPLERLYRGGYDVTTSLDYDLQMQAECAAQAQLARLQNISAPAVASDGSPCDAGSSLPPLDSTPSQALKNTSTEVVVIDPHSGQILALVGEGTNGKVESATGEHPAGTILDPFVYLTAFSRGMSPATMIWELPPSSESVNPGAAGQSPGQPVAYHGPIRLRTALVNDYSAAAEHVVQQVGLDNVWQTERQFGLRALDNNLDAGSSFSDLSTQGVSLLQTTAAYAVFANQGVMAGNNFVDNNEKTSYASLTPTGVLRVETLSGQPVVDWSKPQELAVVNNQLAYVITNVLSDEKARQAGLGHPNGLEIGRAAAAKAGSTPDGNGAWAVGYVPQLAAGVWIGQESGEPAGISVEMATGLWHAVMKYATQSLPVQDFILPAGVSLVQVCDPSGLLVTPICPSIVQESFLTGNEPTRMDDLFTQLAVDQGTGRLATVFTPAQQVENKVFMVVPPSAKAWAKASGIELAPEGYDDIPTVTEEITTAQITRPSMLSQVRGVVSIEGSASGTDFSYYRLEVGQGQYPVDWLQVGENTDQPVTNGRLGTWDTSGLQGQCIIKLMVVRKDNRFEQALLVVNVDNQPPKVQILSPGDGGRITSTSSKPVLVSILANDDNAVQRVEIYLDEQLQATFLEPPYAWLWDSLPGKHVLSTKAYDTAGNASQASVTFSVTR